MEETLTPGVDGAEEEQEEAGKPKPLLPPRELLGKIWFLLAFNVGASHVCWPVHILLVHIPGAHSPDCD